MISQQFLLHKKGIVHEPESKPILAGAGPAREFCNSPPGATVERKDGGQESSRLSLTLGGCEGGASAPSFVK